MKAVLEGLLFVVGDDGLTIDQISNVLEMDQESVKNLILELKSDYEKEDRGLRIDYLGNTLKLTTKREHKEYYKKLLEEGNNSLSEAALEVLAIIAYNEPITRMQVEDIRGISSVNIIKKLEAKGFIKEVGRADTIGKPILYKTTDEFLDYFGLKSIEDLPKIEDVKEDMSETDLFMSRYKENGNEI
jgi:segregation and condensation protein B